MNRGNIMKTFLLATACAVAAMTAAPAMAQVNGYMGASYSLSNVDIDNDESELEGYGASAAMSAPINDEVTLQVNGALSDGLDSDVRGAFTGHLTDQIGDGVGRIGGFAGVTNAFDEKAWGVGMEGEFYQEDYTIAAHAGIFDANELDTNFWALGGQMRFFQNDFLRFDASLGYLKGDFYDEEAKGLTIGFGGEYMLPGTPLSLTAGAHRVALDFDDDSEVSADTFTLGVRYNFGASLRERDRGGASLSGIESMITGLGF